ncbi:hypothetical protein C8A00DRAFT_12432 [Chaetomidium leptoderma]|uniref:Uncharacterized protein n=1 Tax=Chaetomidium leptoderma TaxID=669021 RepID=A0AAN6ZYG7_9PEZI|nr:hypothetical protein C8A00DRAFT_12432 [Chaetomidium leptoderma]
MSPAVTTTTSPSTLLQIHQIAAVLPVSNRSLLTSPSRPGPNAPTTASAARPGPVVSSHRPTKRSRLEEGAGAAINRRLKECKNRQVYPHIDAQIATLPGDRVNKVGIREVVVALVTGAEFYRDFDLRNDGTISSEVEAEVARLAARHVHLLAQRPPTSSTASLAPVPLSQVQPSAIPPAPSPRPAFETPVPLPPFRHSQPEPTRIPPAPSITPRYSSSPIPPPVIPSHPLPNGHGKPNGAVSASRRSSLNPAKTPPEVIVIDDDDDEIPPNTPGVVETAAAFHPPQPPQRRLPNPESPRNLLPSSEPPTAPAALAHTTIWRARGPLVENEESNPVSRWFSEQRQPYLAEGQRTSIVGGAQGSSLQLDPAELATPVTFHVDFTADEVKYLRALTRRTLALSASRDKKDAKKDLSKILIRNPSFVPKILDAFAREQHLPRRTTDDINNLFLDLINNKTRSDPAMLTLQRDGRDGRGALIRSSRVHSLLLAREISGQRGVGSMRCHEHFNNELRKCREDALEKRAEWTGCAGDIFTISWVSNDGFICGTTEHSDSHNQQYNKPGNLVLGSCSDISLRAYPEHRIVRPVVEKGDNAREAMRQSQDPWLYSSVVSSDYDAAHNRAYTCSFDRTVKVWKAEKSGASMDLLGEWRHDGNVNFVATSKHEHGMVATAADVAADAVRIYTVDSADISRSPFRSYSCSRVTDERGNAVPTEKWAYYPATMQWGLADKVKHMLLVGYSPRSRTDDDNDIPVERRDSGELCLWDGLTGERWRVTAATTQNVFEVLWHPSQESFIAATSPLGLDLEPSVRTQIRIFRPADQDEFGVQAYSPIKTLDCTAIDVNELTIMPNSFSFCYVTAGCTDGNTYVWDTARGDKPVHVLRHGEPIDEYRGDREREDVGVKFTAWGTTPDRFYTGSSDGVVKVWNVRSSSRPLVRNLLEAPAPITAGMFCPDKSRLVVGDASGRVFMLSINEEKEQGFQVTKIPLPGGQGFRTIQRPPAIIPHPDPPPPTIDAEGRPIVVESGPAIGRAYLDNSQLKRHANPTIGVVQGPRYTETGLFCPNMHFNEDPTQPLLAMWEATQQEAWKPLKQFSSGRRRDQRVAIRPLQAGTALEGLHLRNRGLDLDIEALTAETKRALQAEGVDFGLIANYLLKEED